MQNQKTLYLFSAWLIVAAAMLFCTGENASAHIGCTNCISGAEDNNIEEDDANCDPPTANDGPQGTNACGMPWWRVSEPFINLWVHDTPLRYRLANGQWFELKLSYKHRREWDDRRSAIGGFGEKWACNWIGLLEVNEAEYMTNYVAGGGMTVFSTNGIPEYRSGWRMGAVAGEGGVVYNIDTPTGARSHYGQSFQGPAGWTYKLRTKQSDRYGRNVVFEWETEGDWVRLKHVYDRDGRSCSFGYTNAAYPGHITSVTDPYGRSAHFVYNASGMLATVIDTEGMPSSFSYDANRWMSSMDTLYGTTSFSYFNAETAPEQTIQMDRAIEITEADGSMQLYAYRDHGSITNDEVIIPLSGTFASKDLQYYDRNSYHWDRKQYAEISATGLANRLNMPKQDYWKATVKHWLMQELLGYTLISDSASDIAGPVLHPSVDDTRCGQIHFEYVGSMKRVTKIVRGNYTDYHESGDTIVTYIDRNAWGRPTGISFYDCSSGGASYANTYDDDGRILQSVTRNGVQIRGYAYDAVKTNLLVAVTNALNEVIRYTHDASNRVTSITYPSGLVTTNFYYTNGIYTGFLAQAIDLGFRSRSFTYTNGNVATYTDELGLTTSYAWDALNRPTATYYPDETYTSNRWDKLDIVGERDRLGYWTSYTFNQVRQLTAVNNANGALTQIEYCGCGSPSQITKWNGSAALITTFDYNLAGQLTNATYPDGYELSYTYDDLERILTVLDNGGHEVELGYNDFDQLTAVKIGSGANQRYWAVRQFDGIGRLTSSTDRNGVTTVSSYDDLDRVLTRYVTGGASQSGTEYFEYDARGLTNYTDALGKMTCLVRDELGRTLYETNANLELLQFTYNPADQMLTLTDGKAQTTRWNYDAEGRVTNKLDAASAHMFRYQYDPNGRLTNRWQAGSITTTFRYDPVGNLTNVVYPTSSNIVLRYDALNRLTNLTDGVGSTAFGWNAGSLLASEDGPWANDTVSYGYTSRQRSSLTVQQPNASPWLQTNGYDAYWRLTNTVSLAGSFATQYKSVTAGSAEMIPDLVSELDLPGGTAITNEFDDLGRLLSTVLGNSSSSILNSHSYQYNEGHQRTKQTFTKGNYLDYTYDDIGQLQTAMGTDSDQTARLQEQFGYGYDAAWNLNKRTNNALIHTFNTDSLNQLTTVTRADTYTVAGNVGTTPTSVTVKDNGNAAAAATVYADSTFARDGITLLDGNNTFTAVAEDSLGRQDTNVVTAYLPATVTCYYDARGNLTNDGRRVFYDDDENQLISVTVSNAWRSEFVYDGFLRRRVRKEYTWSSGWVKTNEVRYVHDGRLVVQERDANNLALVSYTRGNDLSGSLQGAGGIGGLLARTSNSQLITQNSQLASAYYHADGNGNITALVNSNQIVVARYNYDPYGNLLAMSGPLAEANTYRFSSKEFHANSGLVYYGFRFYEPNFQRWPNQDPIGELFDINLFRFCLNSPLGYVDIDGLWPKRIHHDIIDKAFPNLSTAERSILKKASDHADNVYGQGAAVAYRHAMRGPSEKPAEAQARYRQYINEKLVKAREVQDKWCKKGKRGYSPDALFELGLALHAVADSTSPSHSGFQEWDMLGDPLDAFWLHELEESVISGPELNNATSLLQQYFSIPFRRVYVR